ncbi:hypothetical protein [Blautia sp. MSJ-36]|uniref:hypothetical protein n=1 Tax=Blautia sp. MSJ-36 TaxID=2841530 RepID=UPI001C128F05|nr:hypothetical protein [Blautia sp. MSJ-36]MBU5446447.1 hypothetical protein [Blautia sp. MSJ-36]
MSIYTHTYQVKETEVPIIIPDEKNKSEISSKKNLKNRLTTGTVALLIALLAVVSATYAWYVYNTGRHTTKVRMAAGAGVNLQISNSYSGTYGSAAVLDSFTGRLNPVSTNRISGGFVVHRIGRSQPADAEYIFAISDKKNPKAEYNTAKGKEGDVLDCTKADGTTVPFTPYTSDAYCNYNKNTGEVVLKNGSLKLCTISGNSGSAGEPVQIDLYIWLEGCDEDCTNNLGNQTLKNLSVSFAGVVK